ncbi:MAG: PKD domain-containing protein, partial [Candidatus Thorarchaeota archaeon]
MIFLLAAQAAQPIAESVNPSSASDGRNHQLSSSGHLLTVTLQKAYVKLNPDPWPDTNGGEWMFELYVSSWISPGGVYTGAPGSWVDFTDITDSGYISGSSFSFQIRVTDQDVDEDDVFYYTVTVPFEEGMDLYYSGYTGDSYMDLYFTYGISNKGPDPGIITITHLESPQGTQIVEFDITTTDPEGDTLTYEWDNEYNGVDFIADSFSSTTTFTYYSPGQYTVALRVTDSFGASILQTRTVSISELSITAPTSQVTLIAGDTFSFQWHWVGPNDRHEVELYKGDVLLSYLGNSLTGSLDWTVPFAIEPGDDYRVKIRNYVSPSTERFSV